VPDVLESFLERGLLDIGGDDRRLGYFRAAAEALAADFSVHLERVVPTTLAALDPDVPPDDPAMAAGEAELQRQWKTYRNVYRETPRQFIRAVLLEALRIAAEADARVSGAVWLTGQSVLLYRSLGPESDTVAPLLERLGQVHEEAARREWAGSSTTLVAPPQPSISIDELEAGGVDVSFLAKRLGAAAGPSNDQGQAFNAPVNPHWPNNGPSWSYAFPAVAAEGIAKAVNAALAATLKSTNAGIDQLAEQVQSVSVELAGALQSALTTAAADATARRTRLLWWREALYSPAARRSYRELEPALAVLLMATDLATEAGPLAPRSTEYVLREAVREVLIGRGNEATLDTIGGLLGSVLSAGESRLLHDALAPLRVGTRPGRTALAGLIVHALTGTQPLAEEIPNALGVAPDAPLALGDAAVWLFRDVQVAGLLRAPARGKKAAKTTAKSKDGGKG
jgi:hypothetical protein